MEKAAIKGIPYGVASFEDVRSKNRYYVDKTMYLPLLEEASDSFRQKRVRKHDAGVLRYCQGRPL